MTLTINPEFKKLIPPLRPEEYAELEASILADGCRDPLIVWPVDGENVLVDGHNRLEICTRHKIKFTTVPKILADATEASIWIIKNQCARRNLVDAQRIVLMRSYEGIVADRNKAIQEAQGARGVEGGRGKKKTLKQKSAQGFPADQETRTQVAKLCGLSHDTYTKGKYVLANADKETIAKLYANETSINRAYKETKEASQRGARDRQRKASAEGVKLDNRIWVGDFRKLADRIPDGSLSLIFTDPPYDRKSNDLLNGLAEFAEAKLAEGGSLLCYVGQTQLPTALDCLRGRLRYWWTVACVHAGKRTVMREYGVDAGWKAVLWFVKGTRHDNSIMVQDVMSGGEEKDHHEWGQAESEAAYWVEKLCSKDGVVCDPFLGGGTTAAAAKRLGRKWIGIEIDENTAKAASRRISDV